MNRLLLLALLLLAPRLAAATSPAQQITDTLVEALRGDDIRALGTLTTGLQVPNYAFEDLREAIDHYDCIVVNRAEWTIESATEDHLTLRIAAPGYAAKLAEWRPIEELPRWWHVEARRFGETWRIVEVMTGARWTARCMLAAASEAEAERILEQSVDVDRGLVVGHYTRDIKQQLGIERSEHAVELARALHDITAEVFTLRWRAALLALSGRADEAFRCALQAEELARLRGTADDLAEGVFGIGLVHYLLGDLGPAAKFFAASGDLAERCADPIRSIKGLQMTAHVLRMRGEWRESMRVAERQSLLADRVGWKEGALAAQFVRADLYGEMRNVEKVRSLQQNALQRSEEIGNVYFTAVAAYSVAESDLALRLGSFADAAQLARLAVNQVRPAKDFDGIRAITLLQLGRALRADGRTDEAIAVLHQAIGVAESQREALPRDAMVRALSVDALLRGYAVLVELQVERNDVEGALQLAQQMKARPSRCARARPHRPLRGDVARGARARKRVGSARRRVEPYAHRRNADRRDAG